MVLRPSIAFDHGNICSLSNHQYNLSEFHGQIRDTTGISQTVLQGIPAGGHLKITAMR